MIRRTPAGRWCPCKDKISSLQGLLEGLNRSPPPPPPPKERALPSDNYVPDTHTHTHTHTHGRTDTHTHTHSKSCEILKAAGPHDVPQTFAGQTSASTLLQGVWPFIFEIACNMAVLSSASTLHRVYHPNTMHSSCSGLALRGSSSS